MELSKRLGAVAALVSEGRVVADVGCDHGYIPIYLVETKKCDRVIAMDVNAGPLQKAGEHIAMHGLQNVIQTRLSDGVKALQLGECDCVVIAGMGGALTIKILEEGKAIFRELKEFVLQPQSEITKVREYLKNEDYRIIDENMIEEDGKFYPMMKVVNGSAEEYRAVDYRYGKCLLHKQHPVLRMFLEKEIHAKEQIINNLAKESGVHIEVRKQELQKELELAKEALQLYE